jgi:HAD superfamily hydrolase (TIGR01549 family)
VTLTLLLDLDDTLLGNDMNVFLPAYFKTLAGHMASYAKPDDFVATLVNAAGEMIANDHPDRSLKEAFDAAFYPSLGIESEQVDSLQDSIEHFYREIFPGLRGFTQRRPEAVALIEEALDRGYHLVIATNPLFPKAAIMERLSWAGVSPETHILSLVTSYETFHFAKPNPAYFAEILARLGWPDGGVLMVGDDLENDILPARLLGLPAFWINSAEEISSKSAEKGCFATGRLEEVIPWIDSTPSEALIPSFKSPEAMMAILKSTVAALSNLSTGLPDSTWTAKPGEGEWCLAEIYCHLRDVEGEVNLPRVKKVLDEDNPFLPGMVTDPWAEERQYICQDGSNALRDFITLRLQSLEILSGVDSAGWSRPARHAIFGPTNLLELASINAGHDRMHVQQACQVLKNLN